MASWIDATIVAILRIFGLVDVNRSAHRAEVQKECLRTGHTALECKELQ